jgi:CRISPR-associated protein Csm1
MGNGIPYKRKELSMDWDQIILGALLHDIGKFAQRAGVVLNQTDKDIESTCCPLFHGQYSHRHVLYGGKFIRETLRNLFPSTELMALFHHRPDTCTEKKSAMIVALADRLSSGERQPKDDDEEIGKPKEARMYSIFNNLSIGSQLSEVSYFPLKSLSNDLVNHFPKSSKSLEKGESYEVLWDNFQEEAGLLELSDPPALILRQILSLLEKYTLFVPSAAYKERPDLSLFHHLKTTAAITTCYCKINPDEEELGSILTALKTKDKSERL